jgi:RNA polymerase sigma factor (sigma-70 family)
MSAPSERAALVHAHLWIVSQFAARYASKASGVDLREAGLLGLCQAADRYSSRQGKFATYAWNWVKGAILEEIRLAHVIPLSKRAALGKTKAPIAFFKFCGDAVLERMEAPANDPEQLDPERLRLARRRIDALPTPEHRRVAYRALYGRTVDQIAVSLELAPERVRRILAEAEAFLEEEAA